MSLNTSNNNNHRTPKLRFPGFEGEWEVKKLGEIGNFIRGLSYNKSEVTNDSTKTLVIRSNNIIQDECIDCFNSLQFVTKNPAPEQVLRKDDIVICLANGSSNLVGKSASFDGGNIGTATVGAFCGIYRSSSPISKYLVQTPQYKENITLIKQGGDGALANLYGKDILNMRFLLPPTLAEQQKIASCLSSLDELIAANQQQADSLKAHKKGLMQQLFPQPGATTPQRRFPGFEGEWEEKKLWNVFTRITRKNAEDNKNVLTISAQYGLVSQTDFFNKSVAAADVTGYYLLEKGDFAYNKSSSSGNPVGVIKPLKMYDKGVVSTLYICFSCNEPDSIPFWEQYFNAGCLDSEIRTIAQEGARNHGLLNVPTTDFFTLKVLVPTLAEQQKIADCLSALDEQISAQQQKVDALKEHKKGLMQQLFPSMRNEK